MPKDQFTSNLPDQSPTTIPDDLLGGSLPARTGPYRSLSAKRPRDPSHRKSVSFNDVPIVHEVPLHDAMRNANCTTYRSWAYTDATPATPSIPSFYSSQILSPFNSTSAAAQKLHANRLSSSLYSSLSTSSNTASRIPDWALRTKTPRTSTNVDETTATATTTMPSNEPNNNTWSPPVIIVHTPDEKANKDGAGKSNLHSTYNNPYIIPSQSLPPPAPNSSLSLSGSENVDEKKHPYRSAIVPDNEHHRTLPFTYEPVSDSTAIYTSMLSTHLVSPSHTSNESSTPGYMRTARARSATLPITVSHSSTRSTDSVSITPFRTPTTTLLSNGTTTPSRTVLRPTTIAFQCSPSATATSTVTTASTSNASSSMANNNTTNSQGTTVNPSSMMTMSSSSNRPPAVPPRFASSAAAVAAAHSRYAVPPNRTFPHSPLVTSTIKYAFTHPSTDAALTSTTTPQNSSPISKPPPTAYPRSRSANVLSSRRSVTSAGVLMDNHSNGTASNPMTNLYSTAKRNPNVRQNYGSYYMHRVLLPTTIN